MAAAVWGRSKRYRRDWRTVPLDRRGRNRRPALNIVAPIERTGSGYSAYVPDLPGRVAAAATRVAAQVLIEETVRLHLEPMH